MNHAPAENQTRGPTMGMLDFTTKPLARWVLTTAAKSRRVMDESAFIYRGQALAFLGLYTHFCTQNWG